MDLRNQIIITRGGKPPHKKIKVMKKVYIYRVINHNGRKEYKRTKCSNYWSEIKDACWQFTKQGAKGIVETLNQHNKSNYYTFGFEEV